MYPQIPALMVSCTLRMDAFSLTLPIIHSTSKYVKKKKNPKRPKFAAWVALCNTKSGLWKMKLRRGELGLAGKVFIVTGWLERAEFISQVRDLGWSKQAEAYVGLWIMATSCLCCIWDMSESG